MVKPVATNMTTITLQQRGESGAAVKPLVIGEQTVVHTNVTEKPILPHQPVAPEQDQIPPAKSPLSLERIAGLSLEKHFPRDGVKLDDFTREQIDLLYRRYKIKDEQ